MIQRRSSALNERPRDLSLVDRRLSALSIEERGVDMPVGGDLSQIPTIAPDQYKEECTKLGHETPRPDEEGSSGWSTPTMNTPMPLENNHGRLTRSDSQVMQTRKETQTKWARYPKQGYKTTTKFFYEEIDSHWTAVLIVVCFFVSGIVDSVSYQTFSVFTSLQTGNTIFLALRVSNQPASRHPFAYVKSLVSVGSYCIGALFFNMLHRAPTELSDPRPRLHRWTLFTSFIVQSTLLVVTAALAQSGWISTKPFRSGSFSSTSSRNPEGNDNYLDLIPIAFLAFEAAGQVCLSRVLVINELPTIVISTLYHDFMADALRWRQLWIKRKSTWEFLEEQKRQVRRLACIFALFAGAIVGGFVYASPGGLVAALWTAAGTKVVVSVAWCLWRRKTVTETVVTRESATAKGN